MFDFQELQSYMSIWHYANSLSSGAENSHHTKRSH